LAAVQGQLHGFARKLDRAALSAQSGNVADLAVERA